MWSVQYRRDTDLLERIQRRATEMTWGMECLSCVDRLRERGLFSLEKKRVWGDLIAACQYLKGSYRKEGDRLFSRACSDRTRRNDFQLKKGRFRLYIRKKYFTARVMRHWNRLPRDVVDAPSLETFKARLHKALGNLIELWCPCSTQGSWTKWPSDVPSNSKDSMILICINHFICILSNHGSHFYTKGFTILTCAVSLKWPLFERVLVMIEFF